HGIGSLARNIKGSIRRMTSWSVIRCVPGMSTFHIFLESVVGTTVVFFQFVTVVTIRKYIYLHRPSFRVQIDCRRPDCMSRCADERHCPSLAGGRWPAFLMRPIGAHRRGSIISESTATAVLTDSRAALFYGPPGIPTPSVLCEI